MMGNFSVDVCSTEGSFMGSKLCTFYSLVAGPIRTVGFCDQNEQLADFGINGVNSLPTKYVLNFIESFLR